MLKKITMLGAAAMMTATMVVPTDTADAQRYRGNRHAPQYSQRYDRDRGYYRDRARYDRGYEACRRNDGDGGTIIGAIAGGLVGNQVVGRRGDKTLGTIVGGAAGALAGRYIDKSDAPRC